jgi:hypothetical protein
MTIGRNQPVAARIKITFPEKDFNRMKVIVCLSIKATS